jgi:hypothetical protein
MPLVTVPHQSQHGAHRLAALVAKFAMNARANRQQKPPSCASAAGVIFFGRSTTLDRGITNAVKPALGDTPCEHPGGGLISPWLQ